MIGSPSITFDYLKTIANHENAATTWRSQIWLIFCIKAQLGVVLKIYLCHDICQSDQLSVERELCDKLHVRSRISKEGKV